MIDAGLAAGWTRRDLLKRSAVSGGVVVAHGVLSGARGAETPILSRRGGPVGGARASVDPAILIDGTDVRALAMRTLDAAKSAGATYADVRITRQLAQHVDDMVLSTATERLGIGVRAHVQGGWGFSSSPYWNLDEVARLAREAAEQAKSNALNVPQATEWTSLPAAVGTWRTPIRADPFSISAEEKIDALQSWATMAGRYRWCTGRAVANFTRMERVVATSDGTYVTQTSYQSGGIYMLERRATTAPGKRSSAEATGLATTAAGWELFTDADIPGQLPALYEAADPRRVINVPEKRGDIGRYDVVFDARTMGQVLARTLGVATQLDCMLGYEADASGTSYLGTDPLAALGGAPIASSLVTVTANRSMPGGVANVTWDDEGAESTDFTLVKDGVFVDCQTTRELAPLLAPWYAKQGVAVRSRGCAAAQDATFLPTVHPPNLVLEPGPRDVGFDALVADTKRGFAVASAVNSDISVDAQARTGQGNSVVIREIVNGTLGAKVRGVNVYFTTAIFWKNVIALGGPSSVLQYASASTKGQPAQTVPHSIRAVPAKVTGVDILDPTRQG